MAAAARSTIVRIPHPADAAIGAAARDLENEVNDAFDMIDVTMEVAEAYFDQAGDVTITADHVRRLMFCIYQSQSSALRLKTAYYAAIAA